MNENDELYELEKRFYSVDERLEKEKTKRNLILISVYTVFAGFIISRFVKITDLEAIFFVVFFSLISGVLLWIVPLSVFSLITDLFTNINNLEDSKKYLAEEIKRSQKTL